MYESPTTLISSLPPPQDYYIPAPPQIDDIPPPQQDDDIPLPQDYDIPAQPQDDDIPPPQDFDLPPPPQDLLDETQDLNARNQNISQETVSDSSIHAEKDNFSEQISSSN
jgi:hypothetical protein